MIKYSDNLGSFVRRLLFVALLLCTAHAWGATTGKNETTAATGESLSANLVMQAFALIGTKYQRGGNSAETGFDCSGFIRYLYGTVLDLTLPRTSLEMSRLGTKVDLSTLVPGDLVFYNTLRRSFSHVGIYIGEDRFIHSPSKGRAVEIVDMRDRYWQKRYNGARRVMPDSASLFMGPELPAALTAEAAGQ